MAKISKKIRIHSRHKNYSKTSFKTIEDSDRAQSSLIPLRPAKKMKHNCSQDLEKQNKNAQHSMQANVDENLSLKHLHQSLIPRNTKFFDYFKISKVNKGELFIKEMNSFREKLKPETCSKPLDRGITKQHHQMFEDKQNRQKLRPFMKNISEIICTNKRRLCVFGVITTLYTASLYLFQNHKNEAVRMALAGSLSSVICDVSFHFTDTINNRLKVTNKYRNAYVLLQKIIKVRE